MGVGSVGQTGTFNFTKMMNQIGGGSAGNLRAQKNAPHTARQTVYCALGKDQTKGLETYSRVFLSIEDQRKKLQEKKQSNGQKEVDYDHKKYSSRMKRGKSPQTMRKIAAEIRAEIEELYTKLRTGEYDYEDVLSAISHAEAMEQAALKRADNLEKEEMAERKLEREEQEKKLRGEDDEDGGMVAVADAGMPVSLEKQQEQEAVDKELKKIQEQMRKQMQEEMAEAAEEEMEELQEENAEEADPLEALSEMADVLSGHMSEEDIDLMKKKHRAAEDMDIARADMEYLKAKFDRLQRQKDAIKSGAATFGTGAQTGGTAAPVFSVSSVPNAGMSHSTPVTGASVSTGAPSAGASVDVSA